MEPFTLLRSVAVPLDIAKIDTGMIVPGRFLRIRRRPGHADYAQAFLHDLRFNKENNPEHEFVLNLPAYKDGRILVTGPDFGCGSSRESAAYAVLDYGIRALIGTSFGEVFAGNCMQNGILPVTLPPASVRAIMGQLQASPGSKMGVDLEQQLVTGPDGIHYAFEIDETRKERLIKGQDDIDITLNYQNEIETFENRSFTSRPWLPRTN